MPRWSIAALRGVAWVLFLAAIAWPTVAIVVRCIGDGHPPAEGHAPSLRQWTLLGRSIWLAGSAALVCLIVAIPSACLIGQSRHVLDRPLVAALMLAVLLCPPTVYAFGWEKLLPATFDPSTRCVGVWALWAWPIPALLIGSGWSRVARPVYEAALMTVPRLRAFALIALPLLSRYVVLGVVINFVLFLGDYGVPHACLLRVYATELLAAATSSSHAIDALWPAWPVLAVTGVALIALWLTWYFAPTGDIDVASNPPTTGNRFSSPAIVGTCFFVCWVLPMGTLAAQLGSVRTMLDAFGTYAGDVGASLAMALLAGLLAVAMGLGIAARRGGRAGILIWTLALGACPGAVVGAALVAAFNNAVTGWMYDHWPIIMVSYVARYAWIGVVTAWIVVRAVATELRAQARMDGVDDGSGLVAMCIPVHWPTLLAAVAVIATLSLADVATSSQVRVPSVTPIAHILLEKFHRFEDGMLISISLWLALAAFPPAILSVIALRRWKRT